MCMYQVVIPIHLNKIVQAYFLFLKVCKMTII